MHANESQFLGRVGRLLFAVSLLLVSSAEARPASALVARPLRSAPVRVDACKGEFARKAKNWSKFQPDKLDNLRKTLQNAYKVEAEKLKTDFPKECNDQYSDACAQAVAAKCAQEPDGARDYSSGGTAGGLSGMAWQTALFTGLADYLVERAGEELALWLLQSFYKDLCAQSRGWFPESCQLLDSLKGKDAEIPEEVPGTLFSAAIRKDLERFPVAAIRGAYAARADLVPLLTSLAQPGTDAKKVLAQLKAFAERAKQLEACQSTPTDAACAGRALGVALKYMALTDSAEGPASLDELADRTSGSFQGKPICDRLLKEKGSLRGYLTPLFGDPLPPGIEELAQLDNARCTDEAPWVVVDDPKKPAHIQSAQRVLQIAHSAYQIYQNFKHPPKPPRLVFENLRQLESILLNLLRLDGRPELGKALQAATIAAGATDVIEALFSLFTQMRGGASPLELLAGLADLSRKSQLPAYLCQDPGTRDELGCTVVAVGTLVAEFGGVTRLLARESGWDEGVACAVVRDLVESKNLQISLGQLYGAQLPAGLAQLRAPQCDGKDADRDEAYRQVRALLRAIYDLEQQIRAWRSSGAPPVRERVGQLLGLLNGVLHSAADLLDQDDNAELAKAERVLAVLGDMFNANYADGVRGTLSLLALFKDALPEPVRRFLPLIGDLAGAQDAKGVQAALRAAAAPLGSWRRKFHRATFSVSALVGVQTGGEWPLSPPPGVSLAPGHYVGPMAALGLEIGGPLGHQGKRAAVALSGFLSVLDVGQLALARTSGLGDASAGGTTAGQQVEAKVTSNIDFLDVFAPGAYLKLGISKIPLTFGVGPSFAPRLRKYSYTDEAGVVRSPDPFSMIRLNAFVAVDMTLFPIL